MKRSGWKTIAVTLLTGAAIGVGLHWGLALSTWWAMFVGINVSTMLCYGYDKRQARRHKWRVPESALLILAAIGATLGSVVGQQLFRHKTSKKSFRRAFWAIAVLQVILLAWWLYQRS